MPYQLYYPDFKDAATGKTLTVTPGSAYTAVLSPGRVSGSPSYPNDGRWTAASTFQNLTETTNTDSTGLLSAEPEQPVTGKPVKKTKEGA